MSFDTSCLKTQASLGSFKPTAAQRTQWAYEYAKNGTIPDGYNVVTTITGGIQFRRIVNISVETFDKKIASLKKSIEKQEALKQAFLASQQTESAEPAEADDHDEV